MKITVYTIIITLTILTQACSRQKAMPEEYIAYVNNEKNGLIQSREFGEYRITLQYRPLAFEALNNTGAESISKEILDKQLAENSGLEYYLLQIGSIQKKTDALSNGISHISQYQERISQLVSGIEGSVRLVIGTDTFPCVMHHYERNYQMADYHNILLVFEPEKPLADYDRIIIYDDEMLGIGRINYTINKSDIKNIPELTL